jgi:hypothetical protein
MRTHAHTHTHTRAHALRVPQGLVATKLQLAQACEAEVVRKRELYKARETNLKLASKMTKLEALCYSTTAGGGGSSRK